ncbi:hypothetical protein C0585_04195 [Candidatus Woesearchaeota archaeon]|nr:MAG: hypothetical protein C0585_04195 [Candidatus Woesearchaeota archaeon]
MAYNKLHLKTDRFDEEITYFRTGPKKKPLLFLHGFGTAPHKYTPLLGWLSLKYEIIAPVMYGVNCLKNQPTTLEDYANITSEFTKEIGLEDYLKVGHSTGGGVVLMMNKSEDESDAGSIAMNPIMPSRFYKDFFVPHAMMTYHALNLTKKYNLGVLGLLKNSLKDPVSTHNIMTNIADQDWDLFDVKKKTSVIYSEHDEFFKGKTKEKLKMLGKKDNIELMVLPDRNHFWFLETPQKASNIIDNLFK